MKLIKFKQDLRVESANDKEFKVTHCHCTLLRLIWSMWVCQVFHFCCKSTTEYATFSEEGQTMERSIKPG